MCGNTDVCKDFLFWALVVYLWLIVNTPAGEGSGLIWIVVYSPGP